MPPAIGQVFKYLSPTQSELRGSPGVWSPARNSPLIGPALRRLIPQGFPILEKTGHGCPVKQGRRNVKVPAFQAASEPAHK
ncbi:MAG: hypothetical protein ACLP29_10410, partial [Dissulfurispiraceae bacterium]